ncbi:conserved hypothetical protein, partial [Ricinus communis]
RDPALAAVPHEDRRGGAQLRRPVYLHLGGADLPARNAAPRRLAIRVVVHPLGGRHLPRRAGRQPHRRQDDVRAPDRHRLLLPAGGVHRQPAVPLLPAAGAAVDGAADVVLYLRDVGGGAGGHAAGAGPVPAHPRHRGLGAVVRGDAAGRHRRRRDRAGAITFGAVASRRTDGF